METDPDPGSGGWGGASRTRQGVIGCVRAQDRGSSRIASEVPTPLAPTRGLPAPDGEWLGLPRPRGFVRAAPGHTRTTTGGCEGRPYSPWGKRQEVLVSLCPKYNTNTF